MASEDVIELGSSEDEAQPAPKKKKPMPNAMVHIPNKLPGITIKPAKINISSAHKVSNYPNKRYIPKRVLSKPILISKPNINLNTNINKYNQNSTPMRIPILKKLPKSANIVSSNLNRFSINPISVAKNLRKPELVIKKVSSNIRLKNPVEVQGPRLLNNLPPGITIKPLVHPSASGLHKNKKYNVNALKNTVGEVLTVEIDDEEAAETSIESPQWYLRPEEQEDFKNETKDSQLKLNNKIELSLEEQNNREPEPQNFVEITIEDSPVKSLQLKDRSEIGNELAIIIEDSPVKPIKNRNIDSDREQSPDRKPQSKKKLDYPKDRQVVEIEIDLMERGSVNCNENDGINKQEIETNNQDESKIISNERIISKSETNDINNLKDDTGSFEFHPVYQNFIDTCFKLENSEDMKKIVEKKIKAYYKQCPKEYVESEDFIDMVSSKIVAMKSGPEKMYLYIKDIVDELNLQRKITKAIPPKPTDTIQETDNVTYSEGDSKRQRQIRKLEKTIKKLHRAIQKLEEQEVDFEDDEDSVYLLTERYKERMVHVHAKFCQLTNTKMPSEPRIHLEARPGRPTGPVRKLEKWINRKVPIGTPLPFPDFHDVLKCVRDANDEDNLGLNEVDIMEEARDLFTRCGKKLQRRRQENEWRLAVSRLSRDVDPAEESLDLKKKLDENKSVASKRESELLNKYVDRQNQLKLVAEEIGDKEAEESPVESEEEEIDDDNSLTNKQKRKERLKRLLQERNRKYEEKENNPEGEKQENNVDCSENIEKSKSQPKTKSQDDNSNKIVVSTDNDTQISEVDGLKSSVSEQVQENTQKNEIEDKIEIDQSDKNEENEFESDIDELHLLQKLHSENESDVSTLDSSGSDSLDGFDSSIAISDTLESDSDVENKNPLSDVISIENSSYSESEATVNGIPKGNEVKSTKKSKVEDLVSNAFEVKYFTTDPLRKERENIVENILLASSDDENSNKVVEYEGTSINLKDDDISISETTIDGDLCSKPNDLNEKNSLENNNATNLDCSVENKNPSMLIYKQGDEQDNKSLDSVMECSDDDDVVNTGDLLKDDIDIRSTSDVNSVNSVELQMEQNELEINSTPTESLKNIKLCNTELSELNENEKHETQNSTQTDSSTANIETGNNNNMEID
ncbi:unnamed protein product [Euphydryas editha]|uniref:Daxx histone-binding domain-containing protein n=1 Tax=Euphydryas editha TaxID=104508 RepID=A0AAU9UMB4_EUPED|nr:unnamed protein product [Euphydryas editha]